MNTYTVYFRNDLQWGLRELAADTPEQALEAARHFAIENWDEVALDYYDPCRRATNGGCDHQPPILC